MIFATLGGEGQLMRRDATETELAAHLREQHQRLLKRIAAGQTAIAREMAPLSNIRSCSAMHEGLKMLDEMLSGYFDFALESAPGWISPSLPEETVKKLYASELREVLYRVAVPKAAYRPRPPNDDSLEPLRNKIDERLRAFDAIRLSIGGTHPRLNFELMTRSVLEADKNAVLKDDQANPVVRLTSREIEAALERFSAIMLELNDAGLEIRLEPDLQTIRCQLEKEDPNIVILQEAGKSIETASKSLDEWSRSPVLRHASGALSISLGII